MDLRPPGRERGAILKQITLQEMLDSMHESTHGRIRGLFSNKASEALVVFENLDANSSEFGARTVLAVGPDLDIKKVEDCDGKHLFGDPGRQQAPVAFCPASTVEAAPAEAAKPPPATAVDNNKE